MATVEELIIKATPDGMDDVEDGLESMEKKTQETTDSIEDTTNELDSLSKRFRGAMTAIIGGLAIATAGLLSQVPVVGETMDQLGLTITILTQKLDEDLRPAMQGLQEDTSDVNDEVSETEGFIEALRVATDGWVKAIRNFIAEGFQQELKDLTGIDLSLDTIKFLTVGGADPEVIASNIRKGITQEWEDLKQATKEKYNNISSTIQTRFNEIKEQASSILGGIDSEAVEWGKEIISQLIKGIKKRAAELKSTVTGIEITDDITIGDITSSIGDVIGTSEQATNDTSAGATGDTGVQSINSSSASPLVTLDGEAVNDNQGRHRKDTLTLRGL